MNQLDDTIPAAYTAEFKAAKNFVERSLYIAAYNERTQLKYMWTEVSNFFKRNQHFSGAVFYKLLQDNVQQIQHAADYAYLNESTSSQIDRQDEAMIWSKTLKIFEEGSNSVED